MESVGGETSVVSGYDDDSIDYVSVKVTVVDEENPENDVTGSIGKGLSVIGIVAHLTKAIQELEARITTLEG